LILIEHWSFIKQWEAVKLQLVIKLLDEIQALLMRKNENESFSNFERLAFWSFVVFILLMAFIIPKS
jgi:hypothetical protein